MLPEVVVKKNRKEAVDYIATEMGYSPAVCNFLLNTSTGRKLSFLFLKKEMKKEIRSANKEIKGIFK